MKIHSILVVDDASTDRTADLADEFALDCWQCPVRVVRCAVNRGAGTLPEESAASVASNGWNASPTLWRYSPFVNHPGRPTPAPLPAPSPLPWPTRAGPPGTPSSPGASDPKPAARTPPEVTTQEAAEAAGRKLPAAFRSEGNKPKPFKIGEIVTRL